MDITIKDIQPVKNRLLKERISILPVKKTVLRDQRKNRQDRRESVRSGVFVELSFKKNRRNLRDRRKK